MTTTMDTQLLELLEDFKPREDQPMAVAKRPAGKRVLVESRTRVGGTSFYTSLTDFWLHSLHHFLEDSGSDIRWLEGLAYQSVFRELPRGDFQRRYRAVLDELTLPPAEVVELRKAFLLLDGRIVSFMGITEDGDYWASVFGPCYYREEVGRS